VEVVRPPFLVVEVVRPPFLVVEVVRPPFPQVRKSFAARWISNEDPRPPRSGGR
jgi:hypothetical protein